MGVIIASGTSIAIIVGMVESGPNVCDVDILIQGESGKLELIHETHSCDFVQRQLNIQ